MLQLAGATALNQRLATTFLEVIDERAARAKELWQRGKRQEAKDLLAKIKADSALWLTLSSQARAGVLRIEASISLESGLNPDLAEHLLAEAERLSPGPEDERIRASILWYRGAYEEALQLLSRSTAPRAACQLAVMFAALGRIPEAEAALTRSDEQTAERFRVEALVNLCARRLPQARAAILKALEKSPDVANIRRASAIIDYYSALTISPPNCAASGPDSASKRKWREGTWLTSSRLLPSPARYTLPNFLRISGP
jgi:tetratricopeptide (TPR) repeat protein